jgi:rare lipoprotein A
MRLCCFLVVFMKHRLIGGLTVAVVMSAAGVPNTAEALGSDTSVAVTESAFTETSSPGSVDGSAATSSEQTAPDTRAISGAHQQDSDLTNVYPHVLDGKQAATLFVNSIPVLTLTGEALSSAGDSKELSGQEGTANSEDPIVRANGIAQQLLSLAIEGDAGDITVRWDEDQELFVIGWNEQDLVAFNQQTMLAGSTDDAAEDALQAANRLRRLIGDEPPLTEIEGRPEPVAVSLVRSTYTGMASWYGPGFHGRRSASGEVFNQHALTAAHRTLPFGTQVRVTNVHTGQQVVVRINDRGPFSHGRIIDLSAGAAAEIGLRRMGVGRVQVEVLSGQ